ncbi:MAG: choice-of-anchor D domain-containing protein [Deltaproteobacteria bacterium]|nr:choice-of-anchor D domain-containing protein [Deltaproteobacteria bacterium]
MRALVASVLVGVVVVVAGCPAEVAAGCKKTKTNSCEEDVVVVEPPRLFVDPPFGLGYDCVTIGCDAERRLVVENRGGGTIKLSLVRLSIDTSNDFTLRRADDAALPFDEATVVEITPTTPLELFVRYAPSDGDDDEGAVTLDWYDGKLAFEDAVLTHVELPLSTRALGDVAALLQGGRLNFGFVPLGGYSTRDIVIKNDGNGGVLSVGPVTLADGTSTTFQEPVANAWASQFVNPGAEARIPVNFRPDVVGAFSGTIFVQSNDGANPALSIEVVGTAVSDPQATPSTSTLDFQTLRVGAARTVEFLVTNTGGVPLTVQAGQSGAGFAVYPAELQTIAPLEAAAFAAVWSPVSGGVFAGQVLLATNDPTQPQIVIGATGFANAPALSASPATIDFGGVVQGWTTGAGTFFISNNGFGDLTIDTIAFDIGSSSQIAFAEVPPLPVKLGPNDPPIAISVFLEANTLGTTNAVVLVGSDSIDTGFGSGGIARLNVVGRVITCEEGCPTNNGTPSCGTGSCEIGSCDNRFHDANISVGDGCECGEDLVPGGGGTRRDVDGVCNGANIGPLGDDCASVREVRRSGTLHSDTEVDLYTFRATDDSEFFGCDFGSDSFGVRIRLEGAPAGMRVCARQAEDGVGCGGENQRRCGGTELFFGGGNQVFGDSDESDFTVWVEWAPGAQPQCGGYTLFVKGNDG